MRKLDRIVVEKLKKNFFENSRKTLCKNSPFDMKVLAQKHVEKTLRDMEKTGFKISPKSCVKLANTSPFYRVTKTSRWGNSPSQMTYRSTDQRSYLSSLGLSVDRLAIFMTVGVVGRPSSQPHLGLDLSIDRSVDRLSLIHI